MNRIFIGYDKGESVAFHVLVHSIIRRSSEPVSITPIVRSAVPLTRERGELESTDFSITRFLVPYLCNYEGNALFMDCDMLCLCDINDIFDLYDERYTLQVVKHTYYPTNNVKMDNRIQTRYPFKNWSSVMLFNNEKCANLSLPYVDCATGLDLHQFNWVESREDIGDLPEHYNYLVGHSKIEQPAIIHFTQGGPWFKGYEEVEYSKEWYDEANNMAQK